jgi:FMN phosphatase YigB (HAD superfamily)
VVFDVGETLIDETRFWTEWAEWLGVRPLLLNAALGATIATRREHTEAFELVRPGFDAEEAMRERLAAGWPDAFVEDDLFDDARRCLAELRRAGYTTGVAGNQPAWMVERMRQWTWAVDVVTGPDDLGAVKPDRVFFSRLAEALALDPARIAYVGDRVDNDVVPAQEAGMRGVFLRRGPWGCIHSRWPEATRADVVVDSLDELVAALAHA